METNIFLLFILGCIIVGAYMVLFAWFTYALVTYIFERRKDDEDEF